MQRRRLSKTLAVPFDPLPNDGKNRLLPDDPMPRKDLQNSEVLLLEEFRVIANERRFIMERYMQSLLVYPVVMGYGFQQVLTQSKYVSILLCIFLIIVNLLFWFGANHFRSMAYHALNRETLICDRLGFQYPHPMIWGYYGGICAFTIAFLLFVSVIYIRIYHPDWFPTAAHP